MRISFRFNLDSCRRSSKFEGDRLQGMIKSTAVKELFLTCKFRKGMLRSSRCCYWKLSGVPKIAPQTEKWNSAIAKAADLVKLRNPSVDLLNAPDCLKLDDYLIKLLGKMAATKHPLLNESKRLFFDTRLNFQVRGLIALLLAKSVGQSQHSRGKKSEKECSGITDSHRRLAQALELYHTHLLTHNSVLNLNHDLDGEINKSLQSINGIGVLLGDYLAANATHVLTSIGNSKVMSLLSYGVIDFTGAIFCGKVDKNGNMIPDRDSPEPEWKERIFLEHASLLARGCQGIMILSGFEDDERQKMASDFGKNIALAMKINQDIQDFQEISDYPPGTPFTLSLAPIILHLQMDPEFRRDILDNVTDDVTALDFKKIYRVVQDGKGLAQSSQLLSSYITKAQHALHFFGSTQAADLLRKILKSLQI